MKLFAHGGHRFDEPAHRKVWLFQQGTVTDVPDEVGTEVLFHHPERLCDVTGDLQPALHTCAKTPHVVVQEDAGIVREMVGAAPMNRMETAADNRGAVGRPKKAV